MRNTSEAAQPTEMAANPSASTIVQLPQLTMTMPPQMQLAAASAMTKQPSKLVSTYNNVYAYQQHGGTDIHNIITSAYRVEELVQTKTSTFSTQALISLNHKVVH